MTAYATWEDYAIKYLLGRKPSIAEAEFPFWARRASLRIDALTFGRLKAPAALDEHREAALLCVCELAEHFASDVMQEAKGLASISVTGHSMSFDKAGAAKDEREIVTRYFGDTGLLYRGI